MTDFVLVKKSCSPRFFQYFPNLSIFFQTFQICEGEANKQISQSLPKTFDPSSVKKKINKGELPEDYHNGRPVDTNDLMDPKRKKQYPGFSSSETGGQEKTFYQVSNWPVPETMARVGQPSGIAIDIYGNPTVFHRGDRIWGGSTFNWYVYIV